MAPTIWDKITLRYWHGGTFKRVNTGELIYVGGQGRTFQVLADELCYWEILEFAKKCGNYSSSSSVFYLVPGLSLLGGLRKVEDDSAVMEMGKLGMKYRTLDMYVSDQQTDPLLLPEPEPQTNTHFQPIPNEAQSSRPPKLHPKRGPAQNIQSRSSPRLPEVIIEGFSTNFGKPTSPVKPSSVTVPKKHKTPPKHTSKKTKASAKITPQSAAKVPFAENSGENAHAFTANSTSHEPPTSLLNELFLLPPTVETHSQTQLPLPEQPELPDQQATNLNTDDYEWYDNRPDSPLKWSQLHSSSGEDSEDPLYEPESGKGNSGEAEESLGDVSDLELEEEFGDEEYEFEEQYNEDIGGESENSDEEYHIARERVRTCNSKLWDIAQQLQKEAAEGRLQSQQARYREPGETVVGERDGGYQSEYFDSDDDLITPPGSDEEGETGRRSRRSLLVGVETDFSKFEWKAGQRFATRDDFKKAVSKYAIMQGRNLAVSISNKSRRQEMGVKCVDGCPFYIYGSWHSLKASFIVKSVMSEHRCQRNMKKNKQLTSRWVAREMLEVFKSRPHWPAREIKETIKRAYKVLVGRDFCYKVRKHAHEELHGSMVDHYKKLGRYIAALQKASPNSTFDLVVDTTTESRAPVFQRLFCCFEGLVKGWKTGCRRVICVDGAFLKTFLGGQILSAVGRDGNEQMYPICWAVVEGENSSSWEWFFTHLQKSLELGDGSGLAIISDEHPAILGACANVLPAAEHRHCARHVYAHWSKHYRGDEFKLKFWTAAKSYNVADFNEAMRDLNETNPAAATSFRSYNPNLFCRAFMNPNVKSDAITNNMAETFNGYIVNVRTKHIIYMLEDVRVAFMQRLCVKRQQMEKHTSSVCPRIKAMLDKEKSWAAYCEVVPSSDTVFNVMHNLDSLVVDLAGKSCTCKKWDCLGMPCCHAIACIYFLNEEAEDYVEDCYKKASYLQAYSGAIPPCEGERHWPMVECDLDPPPIKIGPGRPRKNRIRAPHEDPKRPGKLIRHGMEMTCKLCNKKGHNKRGCPLKGTMKPPEPPAKKARGRPKKQPTQPQEASTSQTVHNMTPQPSQLGRNGRMVLQGSGSRGAAAGRGRSVGGAGTGRGQGTGQGRGQGRGQGSSSRGRGRAGRVPVGVGVLIGNDGTPFTNVGIGRGRRRTVNALTNQNTQQSQVSAVLNPTQ